MARVDQLFKSWLAEADLQPALEKHYVSAWQQYRWLSGSAYPHRHPALHLQLPYASSRLLSRLLGVWQAQGILPPFTLHWKAPRRVEGRPVMTEEEVVDLLLAVEDMGVRLLGHLVYMTGVKAARLIALRPEDVDWQRHYLHLDQSRSCVGQLPEVMEVLTQWTEGRQPVAKTLLYDQHGQPLNLALASQKLRAAGQLVGRPAIGFGHLQYAHARVLALRYPYFDQELLEVRMQQRFRLKYLYIPNLWDGRPILRPVVSPAENLARRYPERF